MKKAQLHFKVSTGLKTVLGSELITNDEVAIFELVKNSYDAQASRVDIVFTSDTIVISDNSDGMSLQDIQDKWLLVAYSAKRGDGKKDFRQTIADRKLYAGSKGIGRFSCDRLGQNLILQTRHKKQPRGPIHQVTVDWKRFDRDPKELFQSVGVGYVELERFGLPKGAKRPTHGTVITIENTHVEWDRDKILRLKSALAKLINPFGASADGFTIRIIAPAEKKDDAAEVKKYESTDEGSPPNSLANGEVGNFIFDALKQKTTFVDISVTEDGEHIESSLTDRGEL